MLLLFYFFFSFAGFASSLPDTGPSFPFQDTCRLQPVTCPDSLTPPFNYENVKNYIFAHLHYPPEAVEKKIEGTVKIRFTVTLSGKTDSVRITQSVDSLLDEEALRLIRCMPTWEPLQNQGIHTPLTYEIPVIFELIKEE